MKSFNSTNIKISQNVNIINLKFKINLIVSYLLKEHDIFHAPKRQNMYSYNWQNFNWNKITIHVQIRDGMESPTGP